MGNRRVLSDRAISTIVDLYRVDRMAVEDLARSYYVSAATIYAVLKLREATRVGGVPPGLTREQAAAARRLRGEGWLVKDLAQHFGVSVRTMGKYLAASGKGMGDGVAESG